MVPQLPSPEAVEVEVEAVTQGPLPDNLHLVLQGKPPQEFMLDKTVKTKAATEAEPEPEAEVMQAAKAVPLPEGTKAAMQVFMDPVSEMLLPTLAGAYPAELANHTILDQWDMVEQTLKVAPVVMWFLT
jgi:hypothetical protein